MIPGLREQAKGQKVYVEHEYAKLKGVIVGNPESMYLPDPFHPSWYTSFRSLPREKLEWMAANRGKHFRDVDHELWEKMAKGLEALADTYRQAGAHVIQNTQTPPRASLELRNVQEKSASRCESKSQTITRWKLIWNPSASPVSTRILKRQNQVTKS